MMDVTYSFAVNVTKAMFGKSLQEILLRRWRWIIRMWGPVLLWKLWHSPKFSTATRQSGKKRTLRSTARRYELFRTTLMS
ncbi:hypothetical protein CEXT_332211 [Caerostris extrusa]|uniref:Uncharacterized protein n=1 Tax=Caerostris extrusa TaxID=172846 RepID=A0AAV4UMM2_CAEEX|nr:hypothetical protein CEXT_332211 [Caerostris extrusa]